jgi:hypothetical protein
MPTFDGNILTPTRVDLSGDAFQPGMGILVGSPFTEDALIHGDSNTVIVGDHFLKITGNSTTNIVQNETYTVTGNRTTMITGNYTKVIIGIYSHTTISNHMQVNISPRINLYCSPQVETHSAPRQAAEPTGWFETVTNIFFSYILKFEIAFAKIEVNVNVTEAVLSKFEMCAIHTEAKGIENTAEGGNMFLCGLENKLDAIGSRLQAMQPSLGILKGHVVATTLKTLVLGVNQWI